MYGGIDGTYDSAQCVDSQASTNSWSNSDSVISKTLSTHCDCTPRWMSEDVYFEPITTLYIAIFVVIMYLMFNRLYPLVLLVLKSIFKTGAKHSSKYVKITMDRYQALPEAAKQLICKELKEQFPDMPNIGSRSLVMDVDFSGFLDSEIFQNWRSCTQNINPAMVQFFEQECNIEAREVWTKLINMLHDDGFKPARTAHKDDMIVNNEKEIKSSSDGIDASTEWVKWAEKLSDVQVVKLCEAILSGLKNDAVTDERKDSLILLAVDLLLGIYVLLDYFLVQVWPSGSAWQCRFAYFAAVVMYKPFTIPMWSCLTLCSHYCFSALLYKDVSASRDIKTGTVFGSPLPRNKVTFALLGIVLVLQLVWFIGMLPAILPLVLAFFPVVILPSFFLPLLLIVGTQVVLFKFVGWSSLFFKSYVLEAVKKDGSIIRKLHSRHRNDIDVLRTAISQDKTQVKHLGRDTLMAALDGNLSVSLKHASQDLCKDKEFVLKVMKVNGLELEHAELFRRDVDVLMAAVKQNGLALQYGRTSNGYFFQNEVNKGSGISMENKQVVLTAIANDPQAINFAPPKLREDPAFMAEVNQIISSSVSVQVSSKLVSEDHSSAYSTNYKTPPFDETVLILKAAATQLISVSVLCFSLLPLYEHGFSWWEEGARQFVLGSFDYAVIIPQFSVSFGWPQFSQPRVQFQFAIGLLVLVMKYLIKIGKWFLFTFANEMTLPSVSPGTWEIKLLKSFSGVTWQLFRAPMEIIQFAVEKLIREVSEKISSRDYLVGSGMIMFAFPLIVFYSFRNGRTKTLQSSSGDNEVIALTRSEDSMSIIYLELFGKGTTLLSLEVIKTSCPWIKVTKLKLSITTKGI